MGGTGTNGYIYGLRGMTVEQVSSGGTVTYLHHDQQGSIRLLTGSAGTVTGKCTYGAYGTPTCEGASTTPLGFDGQYTSTDTGLIYMRARVYDPATAQFLTVDPLVGETEAPYNYAGDNPLNASDPTGLLFGVNLPSWEEAGESIAGWGDKLTFGATKWAREQLGDENVNTCSAAYQAGGYAGLATALLIPGEDEAEGAAQADQAALRDIVDEATNGGRTPLSPEDAKTVGEWASETGYPGARANPNDVASPSNWKANPEPHVHLPGAGEVVMYRSNLAQNHGDG